MKIVVYLTFQKSLLRLYYHDSHAGYTTETTSWLQTKALPVITIDSFQTSEPNVRCWKWFTETHQIIIVASQTHRHPYHYYIILYILYRNTAALETPKVLPSLSSMHTHNTHSSVVLCIKTFVFVFENLSNKITTDSLTNCCFLPV